MLNYSKQDLTENFRTNNMTDLKDIFRLFPSSKSALKLDTLNCDKLTPSIVHLFNEVVDEFLQVLSTNSESTSCSVEEDYFSKLLLKIDSVLNYIWEQFHTGEWKNVDETWRQLYSYSSIFKGFVCLKLVMPSNEEVQQQLLVKAVGAADMGLIMGAPVLDGLLSTIADSINNKLSNLSDSKKCRLEKPADCEGECDQQQNSMPLLDKSKSIEIVNLPSIEKFISEIMDKKPVIVTGKKDTIFLFFNAASFFNDNFEMSTGAMDFWPAMGESRWSVDYLRKIAGYRTVPIEIGSKYTDDSWSQSLTTVNEFIENFIVKPNKTTGYLAQYQLFQQIPQLQGPFCLSVSSPHIRLHSVFFSFFQFFFCFFCFFSV